MVGDVALDRYLHIDPSLVETSIETGRVVRNVVSARSQGGAAGNVLANLAALRPASLTLVGCCGDDGEGYELRRSLEAAGADLEHFLTVDGRMTFTYVKPMLMHPDRPPEELDRLDLRPREAAPRELQERIIEHMRAAVEKADVIVAMDQAPEPECSLLSRRVKDALAELARAHPSKVFLADSRSDVRDFRDVRVKVNESELRACLGAGASTDVSDLAVGLSREIGRDVFVTLGERGILAVSKGKAALAPGLAVEAPIDIVGAGDTALANLAMALGAGASPIEAARIANAAASVVVGKIGTTGTAAINEIADALQQA